VQTILNYANVTQHAPPHRALDLGCGPGQLASLLADTELFDSVLGVDPSRGMIDRARSMEAEQTRRKTKVDFAVSSAENLAGVKDESLSLVAAGAPLSPRLGSA
jgi:ubiquinone/menaquinone biosynthesis C-methylase UbiE